VLLPRPDRGLEALTKLLSALAAAESAYCAAMATAANVRLSLEGDDNQIRQAGEALMGLPSVISQAHRHVPAGPPRQPVPVSAHGRQMPPTRCSRALAGHAWCCLTCVVCGCRLHAAASLQTPSDAFSRSLRLAPRPAAGPCTPR
jgi:hypothetical protein